MPYDLSFWGVLRRPLLFSIYLLFLFPLYGVDSICVIVLYFCLYKYDEYQLVKFIIGAKGLQFLTAGLICGALARHLEHRPLGIVRVDKEEDEPPAEMLIMHGFSKVPGSSVPSCSFCR